MTRKSLNTDTDLRFWRCIVQSTLGMAPLNLCFNILFYVFLILKNTFGHWAPLH